jgi:hypothetical protein
MSELKKFNGFNANGVLLRTASLGFNGAAAQERNGADLQFPLLEDVSRYSAAALIQTPNYVADHGKESYRKHPQFEIVAK